MDSHKRRNSLIAGAFVGTGLLAYYYYNIQQKSKDPKNCEDDGAGCCGEGCGESDLEPRADKSGLAGSCKDHNSMLLYVVDSKFDTWPRDVGGIEKGAEPSTPLEIIKSTKVKGVKTYALDIQSLGVRCSLPFDLETGGLFVYPQGVYLPPGSYDPATIGSASLEGDISISKAKDISNHPIILVCCHKERDARCGFFGHKCLIKLYELSKEYENMSVLVTSHVGGHKFAPNIICLPSTDYYGLCEDALPEIIKNQYEMEVVTKAFWRGRVGMSKQETKDLMASSEVVPTHVYETTSI